jgi:hypothetical protein
VLTTVTTNGNNGVLKPVDALYVLGQLTFSRGIFNNQLSSANVTVAGNVAMSNAQVNMGGSAWTVGGNWDHQNIGTFNANRSTVTLNGSGKTMRGNGSGMPFYGLVISGSISSSGNAATNGNGGALLISGTYSISGGHTVVSDNASDLKVTSSGRLTGAGSFYLRDTSSMSQQDGVVDVADFRFMDRHISNVVPSTIQSSQVMFTSLLSNSTCTFQSGTYVFTGDVVYAPSSNFTLNIDNSVNNPNFVFSKNVSIQTSSISWTKGTGTISFSSDTVAQQVALLGRSVENMVSSNTSSGGLTFVSSFTTPSLYVNASGLSSSATVYFAGQSTFTISTFTVTGSGSNVVVLKSTDSTQWRLNNTSQYNVNGVQVSSSNAIGNTIYAYNSSGANTTNWVFMADTGVRYWIATGTSSWSSASNWSTVSGGLASGGVPSSSHTVVFDANSKGNPIVSANITIASMTISGSTATINTNGYTVTISSALTQTSGTLSFSTSTVNVGENFTRTAGTFNAGSSTISFNGSQAATVLLSGASVYHLVINKSAGVITTLGGDARIDGNFTIQSGTLTAVGSQQVSLRGNWNNQAGWFDAGTSTVTFVNTSDITVKSSTAPFYGVRVIGTGAVVYTDSMTIQGRFSVDSAGYISPSSNQPLTITGDVNIQSSGGFEYSGMSSTITLGGSWLRGPSGYFGKGFATLVFNSSDTATLKFGGNDPWRVVILGTGPWNVSGTLDVFKDIVVTSGTLTYSGTGTYSADAVTINGGTLQLGGAAFSVNRWVYSSGSFQAQTSTVSFTSSSAGSLTSGGQSFTNVSFTGSGSNVLNDSATISGIMTLSNGVLQTSSQAIAVGGNWIFSGGTYVGIGSTVTFTSTGTQTLSGSTTFYALRALTSGATIAFTAGTTNYVTNMVEFSNLSIKSTTNGATSYFVYSGSSQTLTNLRVRDNNAGVLGGLTMVALGSTDLTNNTNWVFTDSGVRYWIGTSAGNWNSASNWATEDYRQRCQDIARQCCVRRAR